MTALDDRPAISVGFDPDLSAQRGELLARRLNETEAYDFGYHDGYAAGLAAAETEIAEQWAEISRRIRADANRSTPYAERRAREREWAKPRPGDFTGRLTAAEYFGAVEQTEAA